MVEFSKPVRWQSAVRVWQLHGVIAWLASLALLLIVRPAWVLDPFIRHDDYLVFFPAPDLTYLSTLTEGRWLNQLWTWRGFQIPAPATYLLALALWCGAMAIVAARLFADDRTVWRTLVCAVALTAVPQSAILALWINVQVPAWAVLVAWAIFLVFANARQVLLGLPVAVTAALMTYPTNAFILLAMTLALTRVQKMAGRLAICGMFVLGCLGGVVTIFLVNGAVHGNFGLKLSPWREPRPARSVSELFSNLDRVGFEFGLGESAMAGGLALAVTAAAVAACLVSLRDSRPPWLRGLLLGGGISVLATVFITMVSGSPVPARAMGFAWSFVVLGIAVAAREGAGRVAVGALAALALVGLLSWRAILAPEFQAYQSTTRALAHEVVQASSDPDLILIRGALEGLPDTVVLIDGNGLLHRLSHLTGARVIHCPERRRPPVPSAAHPTLVPWITRAAEERTICAEHKDALDRARADDARVVALQPGVAGVFLGR